MVQSSEQALGSLVPPAPPADGSRPQVSVTIAKTLFTAVVKPRTSDGPAWTQTVNMVSVSHSGAGFYIRQECQPGSLVSLLLPMPTKFRRYDQDKKLYRVWGLVQHCHPILVNDEQSFHVGVAFVGKEAPDKLPGKQSSSYRVCGVNEDGFWEIEPIKSTFRTRREPRFLYAVELTLFELNEFDATADSEMTVTENISERGASAIAFLNVNVGDRVRVYSQKYDFSAFALVRNRQSGPDDRPRVHLEFIDNQFPIREIESAEGV